MALVSNFSGFCLSANALHLTSNLNRVFAGKILFLLSLEVLVDCLLVSGTSGGKSTFIYIVSLSAVYCFSSPATSKPVFFSLCLYFSSFPVSCSDMVFVIFILLGVFCVSKIYELVNFMKFDNFGSMFLNMFMLSSYCLNQVSLEIFK